MARGKFDSNPGIKTMNRAIILLLFLSASGAAYGAPTVPPAKTESGVSKAFGDLLGEGGGKITYKGAGGMSFDKETGQPVSIRLMDSVSIKSDMMNLKCDDLEVNLVTQQLVAKGGLVEFEFEGASGTCGRLTYDIEAKKTVLEINPVVTARNENGGTYEIRDSDKIIVTQVGNATNITTEGGGELNIESAPKAAEKKKLEKKPAQKIDNDSVGKIPSPSISK